MPKLEDYQTEHLFLLIGGNPLPNYVAAKLLAKDPNGNRKPMIHLVFSSGDDGTKKYAEKLREVLNEDKYEFKNLTVIPSRQFNIYNQVKDRIAYIIKNGSTSIGINYTGGTKAMAVHAYRAVKENCGNIKPIFSYLDSREMKMCIDQETNANRIEFELNDSSQSYFKDIEINVKDLLSLHSKKIREIPRKSVRFITVLDAIYKEFSENYENWNLFRKNREKPDFSLVPNIKTELERLQLIENNIIISNESLREKGYYKFSNYLFGGDWLEDFVLKKVLDLKSEKSLGECGSGLETERDDGGKDFEIDGIFLRGYQLFLATCSISHEGGDAKATYKGKIFEALWRARQLGGDEAEVALFCLASDSFIEKNSTQTNYVNLLENELQDSHITIFGKEDILDKTRFTNKLREWFEKR